ncbi:MAG: ribonuclease III domain-containing protein [Oscillospiraceae bacterium]
MLYQTGDNREANLLNPLTLAFVGDGVYELLVRERIIAAHGSLSAGKLHTLAVGMVRAPAQAAAYRTVESALTEQEQTVYRRGRNANGVTVPKSASTAEYRSATGMETLFGWLHLTGQADRIRTLFSIILDGVEHEMENHSDNRDTTVL